MILGETWATSKNLEVTVISGNQLPTSERDIIDPYIVIEVLTPNQSFAEFKTKTIKVCSIFDHEYENIDAISGALITLSLSILILNSEEGAGDGIDICYMEIITLTEI